MNHNPHNFKPGDTVRLDANFANTSVVVIMTMTPKCIYSRVVPVEFKTQNNDNSWVTRTDRLTPLENEK